MPPSDRNPPEIDAALEALGDHPHAWRWRQLVDEDNPDREQRDGYRRGLLGEMIPGEEATFEDLEAARRRHEAMTPDERARLDPCCGG